MGIRIERCNAPGAANRPSNDNNDDAIDDRDKDNAAADDDDDEAFFSCGDCNRAVNDGVHIMVASPIDVATRLRVVSVTNPISPSSPSSAPFVAVAVAVAGAGGVVVECGMRHGTMPMIRSADHGIFQLICSHNECTCWPPASFFAAVEMAVVASLVAGGGTGLYIYNDGFESRELEYTNNTDDGDGGGMADDGGGITIWYRMPT